MAIKGYNQGDVMAKRKPVPKQIGNSTSMTPTHQTIRDQFKRQGSSPDGGSILPGDAGYEKYHQGLIEQSKLDDGGVWDIGGKTSGSNNANTGGTGAPVPSVQGPNVPPPQVTPPGVGGASTEALNNINSLSPGMTPEQLQLLRNQAANQAATQRNGSEERIRAQMQRSGLSGSGIETSGLLQSEMANQAGLQSSLTDIGLNNANMQRENAIKLAGLGVEAASNVDRTNLGYAGFENQQQMQQAGFGNQQYLQSQQLNQQQGQYNTDFDWQKYLQNYGEGQYQDQRNDYKDIWKQMGLATPGGSTYGPGRAGLSIPTGSTGSGKSM